jgi:hypothetical protein
MAKKPSKKRKNPPKPGNPVLERVNLNAAGIDIGAHRGRFS